MSVSIRWTPVSGHYLKGGTSETRIQLEKVFGNAPITLTLDHLPELRAMAAVQGQEVNPFYQLINAIGEYDEIIVTFEY